MSTRRFFVVNDTDLHSAYIDGPHTLDRATHIASEMTGWRAVVEVGERFGGFCTWNVVRTWTELRVTARPGMNADGLV